MIILRSKRKLWRIFAKYLILQRFARQIGVEIEDWDKIVREVVRGAEM